MALAEENSPSKPTELWQSEERLRMILESMNEGLRVIENDVHTFVTPRYCEMTGYSEDEIIGKPSNLVFDEGFSVLLGSSALIHCSMSPAIPTH